MNVPMKGGPTPTVAVVPIPESEMDALLLGRTAVRTFDQYVRNTSNIVSNIWNNRLAYAVLDYYPLKECQEVYSKEFVTHKNFCAGFFAKGGGACNRDAGGPGVAYGKLYGVVSFGAPNCGAPDAPTVFTKLGFYAKWIEGIIEMKVPSGRKSTTEQTKRETYRLVMATKPTFQIAPVTKRDIALRTNVPSEDALRTLNENKLFKEFLKTMFGSEEVKEYLDQYDSDPNIGIQQKLSTKDIITSFIVKPIAETTTEAKKEERSSGDLEVSQDVHEGSDREVTIVKNFEEPVTKSEEEEDTTTLQDTTPMIMKMDVKDLTEQNIAKLINDIDVEELLESIIENSSGEKAIKPKKPKSIQHLIQRKEMESNEDYNEPKIIKLITEKIKPIDVISSNDKFKPLEIKLNRNKIIPIDVISDIDKMKPKEMEQKGNIIKPTETQHHKNNNKPKKQTSQKKEKTEITVESTSESVEESETNDDYIEESSDDDDYDIYNSDDRSQGRLEKAREVTFRQNSADGLFSHKDLLKLLHEVVAEVVESATSEQNTRGTIARR